MSYPLVMMINVDGLVRPAVSICIEHYNSPLVVQSGIGNKVSFRYVGTILLTHKSIVIKKIKTDDSRPLPLH